MAKRKTDLEWAAIEKDFRLGQLTLREIARRHEVDPGALSRKAKKEGWSTDKSAEIRQRTHAALISEAREPTHEDIQKAVLTNVELVRQHRAILSKLRVISTGLADKLLAIIDGDYTEAIKVETPMGEMVMLPFLGRNESISDALNKLTTATARYIPLERQAFNMDEQEKPTGGLTDLMQEIAASSNPHPAIKDE